MIPRPGDEQAQFERASLERPVLFHVDEFKREIHDPTSPDVAAFGDTPYEETPHFPYCFLRITGFDLPMKETSGNLAAQGQEAALDGLFSSRNARIDKTCDSVFDRCGGERRKADDGTGFNAVFHGSTLTRGVGHSGLRGLFCPINLCSPVQFPRDQLPEFRRLKGFRLRSETEDPARDVLEGG